MVVDALLAHPPLRPPLLPQRRFAVGMDAICVAFVTEVHEVVVPVAAAPPAGRYYGRISHLLHSRLPAVCAQNRP